MAFWSWSELCSLSRPLLICQSASAANHSVAHHAEYRHFPCGYPAEHHRLIAARCLIRRREQSSRQSCGGLGGGRWDCFFMATPGERLGIRSELLFSWNCFIPLTGPICLWNLVILLAIWLLILSIHTRLKKGGCFMKRGTFWGHDVKRTACFFLLSHGFPHFFLLFFFYVFSVLPLRIAAEVLGLDHQLHRQIQVFVACLGFVLILLLQ